MVCSILTEAGEGIGRGHLSRCTAIAEALDLEGHEVRLAVRNVHAAEPSPAFNRTDLFDWIDKDEECIRWLHGSDAVLVDSYFAPRELLERVASETRCAAFMDDTQRIRYPRGLVINGAAGAEEISYQMADGRVYLLGTRYAPLRSSFWEAPKKNTRLEVENVIVYLSEKDPQGLASRVIDSLRRAYPAAHFTLLAGSCGPETRDCECVASLDGVELARLMAQADCACAAGGQILYELARMGVPTVGIQIADNQKENCRGMERAGFLEFAGKWDDGELAERLDECLMRLARPSVRAGRSAIGQSLVDGKGAERIADTMLRKASAR